MGVLQYVCTVSLDFWFTSTVFVVIIDAFIFRILLYIRIKTAVNINEIMVDVGLVMTYLLKNIFLSG